VHRGLGFIQPLRANDRELGAGSNVMGTIGSRRDWFKTAGAAALAAGLAPALLVPGRARAQPKTLRILQWKHFVPSYDEWFNATYVKEWGERNDTQVIVDNVGVGEINALARAEAEAQRGHDVILFINPPTAFEDHVIDHREIYEQCQHQYGARPEFITKGTYNPKNSKYFGFGGAYLPPLITYRKEFWDSVQAAPDSWDEVLAGGRRIRLLHGKPVGISLASEQNGESTMRAIMYSFGSSEQDADGNPTLKSKATLEVIKYVTALYRDAMSAEVLTWDAASNNRFMLNGEGCLTLDTMSIARASESLGLEIASDLRVAAAPMGPAGRLGPSFGLFTYVIWNFAENIEGAKQFLVDYIASSRDAFLASGFQNMPSFAGTVPDLPALVANDRVATPPDKYAVLAEGASWTTNFGYPGYTNAAIAEVFDRGVVSRMLARAATGELTPDDALDQADAEVRQIFERWRDGG
jgi:multiple sugar transport system substrate-binding protein